MAVYTLHTCPRVLAGKSLGGKARDSRCGAPAPSTHAWSGLTLHAALAQALEASSELAKVVSSRPLVASFRSIERLPTSHQQSGRRNADAACTPPSTHAPARQPHELRVSKAFQKAPPSAAEPVLSRQISSESCERLFNQTDGWWGKGLLAASADVVPSSGDRDGRMMLCNVARDGFFVSC